MFNLQVELIEFLVNEKSGKKNYKGVVGYWSVTGCFG